MYRHVSGPPAPYTGSAQHVLPTSFRPASNRLDVSVSPPLFSPPLELWFGLQCYSHSSAWRVCYFLLPIRSPVLFPSVFVSSEEYVFLVVLDPWRHPSLILLREPHARLLNTRPHTSFSNDQALGYSPFNRVLFDNKRCGIHSTKASYNITKLTVAILAA